ncbi:MAG: sensor histidine kinase [Flammeovirgaceae bacterium]
MKKNIFHSLYWRISAALLALLICLGVAYIFITATSAQTYYQETSQRLNGDVAQHLVKEVKPFINGKVNEEAVGNIMHSMMAVNPSLEVYLLDTEGEILKYVVLKKNVKLSRVDLAPIHQFLASDRKTLIVGDDPRKPDEQTIFSATKVEENGQLQGYVYIVLASEEYDNVTSSLWNSYLLRVGTSSFFLTLLAALLIGLWALWLLTKNLRKIIDVVKKFEEGDLHARVENVTSGEMELLSSTFNSMADTILKNIEDLKQVDHLRRELIANVSHDLRTPISVISGYIETLHMKQGKLSEEQVNKYLKTILNSTEKLKRLVSDLFELTKLEARQIKPNFEQFNLSEVLALSCQKYQILAQKKQISIKTKFPENVPLVQADLSLIERVIQNLMDNAIKYTPEHGEVELSISSPDQSQVAVAIQNTGEGIPEEELPNIFDRYYKGSPTKGSTGLGLAIVKNILEIHQSKIQVMSIPKKFTKFYFSLPAMV